MPTSKFKKHDRIHILEKNNTIHKIVRTTKWDSKAFLGETVNKKKQWLSVMS